MQNYYFIIITVFLLNASSIFAFDVTGKVLDSTGREVVGAKIIVWQYIEPTYQNSTAFSFTIPPRWQKVGEISSDASGVYSIIKLKPYFLYTMFGFISVTIPKPFQYKIELPDYKIIKQFNSLDNKNLNLPISLPLYSNPAPVAPPYQDGGRPTCRRCVVP
jgi:hypothetical protein